MKLKRIMDAGGAAAGATADGAAAVGVATGDGGAAVGAAGDVGGIMDRPRGITDRPV